MTPFFQASRRSLAYQFTIIAPLLCPPFSNVRKFFHFQPCFGQNFSSQDANFPNFRSLDPSFFKENPLPRPYFCKPVWHIYPPKKVECPPPGREGGRVSARGRSPPPPPAPLATPLDFRKNPKSRFLLHFRKKRPYKPITSNQSDWVINTCLTWYFICMV